MIPVERLAELAELYDQYNNAFDPLSPSSIDAKRRFNNLLSSLHTAHAADLEFVLFRYEAVKLCREYLKKN